MTTQTDYEPFAAIIHQGLAERGSKGAIDRHTDHIAPRYVVQMCEALIRAIHDAGNPSVTLAEVVSLESTCTGTDYAHKLAMRCHRLVISAAG